MSTVKLWDVVDGGILGAVVPCHECGGSGELHRPYRTPDGRLVDVHRQELVDLIAAPDESDGVTVDDLVMQAWGVIANAHDGNWDTADPEWRAAAVRFRDGLHVWLGGTVVSDLRG